MFTKHIEQADKGCDFDFLTTGFGAPVPEPDEVAAILADPRGHAKALGPVEKTVEASLA